MITLTVVKTRHRPWFCICLSVRHTLALYLAARSAATVQATAMPARMTYPARS